VRERDRKNARPVAAEVGKAAPDLERLVGAVRARAGHGDRPAGEPADKRVSKTIPLGDEGEGAAGDASARMQRRMVDNREPASREPTCRVPAERSLGVLGDQLDPMDNRDRT